VVSEVSTGIEPEIEYLPQSVRAEIDLASFVYESYDRKMLLAEWLEQFFGHRADAEESARPSVASPGKVIDCYRHLAICSGDAGGEEE